MAVIERADPNVGPGRRNHEGSDSIERVLVADGLSVSADVIKPFAAALPNDSGTLARDVSQMSGLGRCHGITAYCSKHSTGEIPCTSGTLQGPTRFIRWYPKTPSPVHLQPQPHRIMARERKRKQERFARLITVPATSPNLCVGGKLETRKSRIQGY